MPVLEDVNVMEMDRATSKLEEVRENPTRVFVSIPLATDAAGVTRPIGTAGYYTWQNGNWFDTGGNWIQDENQVPQFARDEIAANRPIGRVSRGPAVTAVCQFCAEKMNSSEMEAHLVAHMNETLRAAGQIMDKGERPVTAKNTHRGT